MGDIDESRIAAVWDQDTGASDGRARDASVTPVDRRDGSEKKRTAMVNVGAMIPKLLLEYRRDERRIRVTTVSERPAHAIAVPSNKTGIARVLLRKASAKLDSELFESERMRSEDDDMPYAPVAMTSPTATRVLAKGA